MDHGYESSKYRKSYDASYDNLAYYHTNALCWLDLLHVKHVYNFERKPVVERELQAIITAVEKGQEKNKAPPRGNGGRRTTRVAVRSALVVVQKSAEFAKRESAVLAVVHECLALLNADQATLPVKLQQVVHFYRGCNGANCELENPIYGDRYHCDTCDTDYCGRCFRAHGTKHVLSLHQEVLPEDAATPKSRWHVRGIKGHVDSAEGRKYWVRWAGNWADELLPKKGLNNDELINE